jgi:starvation-inducible DNA-binding protein
MATLASPRYPEIRMEKRSIARSEALLDAAVELTFPASDPISIDHAFLVARERENDFHRTEGFAMAASPGKEQAHKTLKTPNEHSPDAVTALGNALNPLAADAYALFLKTKNFHWHVSGPHFRDYHLLLDEQATEILAITDLIAERVRKLGGATLRSIGHIARLQRLKDNDETFVPPGEMLRELMEDNRALVASMREAHKVCDEHRDVASASLLEEWMEEGEKRVWFLFETSRGAAH